VAAAASAGCRAAPWTLPVSDRLLTVRDKDTASVTPPTPHTQTHTHKHANTRPHTHTPTHTQPRQTYLAASRRCGLSDGASGYWELHIKEDERHGRQMLEEVALPLVDM
jgi:hypothetical protein